MIMKKGKYFYIGALSVSLAAFILSMVMFCIDIRNALEASGGDTWTMFSWYIVTAAFIAADAIATVFCLMGKMKERSVIYSVSRLFIFIFAMKMRENYPILIIPMISCPIMYVISLLRGFREFSARKTMIGEADKDL